MLKCSGIDSYSNKNLNFREIFSFSFFESFFLILVQNRQFDFDFEKVKKKKINAVICGKKVNAGALQETTFFPLFLA